MTNTETKKISKIVVYYEDGTISEHTKNPSESIQYPEFHNPFSLPEEAFFGVPTTWCGPVSSETVSLDIPEGLIRVQDC